MPYVRDRMQPKSADEVRARRERNRASLTEPYSADDMRSAYGWYRAAAAYALRRSYPTLATGQRAHARREQIVTASAELLQACADEIWGLLPAGPHPRRSRAVEFQTASVLAKKPRDKQTAAKAWLMYAIKQVDRYEQRPGEVHERADHIQARATGRYVAWAEEMDADDYGQ